MLFPVWRRVANVRIEGMRSFSIIFLFIGQPQRLRKSCTGLEQTWQADKLSVVSQWLIITHSKTIFTLATLYQHKKRPVPSIDQCLQSDVSLGYKLSFSSMGSRRNNLELKIFSLSSFELSQTCFSVDTFWQPGGAQRYIHSGNDRKHSLVLQLISSLPRIKDRIWVYSHMSYTIVISKYHGSELLLTMLVPWILNVTEPTNCWCNAYSGQQSFKN
jgi:hypothetical protein